MISFYPAAYLSLFGIPISPMRTFPQSHMTAILIVVVVKMAVSSTYSNALLKRSQLYAKLNDEAALLLLVFSTWWRQALFMTTECENLCLGLPSISLGISGKKIAWKRFLLIEKIGIIYLDLSTFF